MAKICVPLGMSMSVHMTISIYHRCCFIKKKKEDNLETSMDEITDMTKDRIKQIPVTSVRLYYLEMFDVS